MDFLDFYASLKTYAIQQYFDSISDAGLSLKNSREPCDSYQQFLVSLFQRLHAEAALHQGDSHSLGIGKGRLVIG